MGKYGQPIKWMEKTQNKTVDAISAQAYYVQAIANELAETNRLKRIELELIMDKHYMSDDVRKASIKELEDQA